MSKIDKIFKDKLHEHSGSYSHNMWDMIEQELHPVKKKNRGFLFFLLGFLLVSLIGLSYYFINNQQSIENNDPTNTISTLDKTETANVDLSKINNTGSEVNDSKNELEAKIELENNISELAFNNSKSQNLKNPFKQKNTQIINTNPSTSNTSLFSNIANTRIGLEVTTTDENLFETKTSIDRNQNRIISISNLERLNKISELSSIKKNNTLAKLSRRLNRNRTECPSFSKEIAGVMIDLYYSHEYGLRKLGKQVANDGVDDYISIRNNTEKSLYSFSAGIRLAFMLPNNMGLKTGLNYSQINEKFEYQDPESIKTQKIEVTEYEYENGIVVDSMVTTQTIQVPGEDRIKVYNKYRSMDIPILFSYEWAGTHGFYFSGNGGVLLNFAFNQKGMIIGDDNLQPQWISSSLPERYKAFDSSLGVSLYGSMGVYYNLSKHFDLMLEPNVRINLKSMTLTDHALSQKYIVPGFITGLRVKF